MPFKKPTSLSDSFQDKFDLSKAGWVDDFIESDEYYAISSAENAIINRFRVILEDGSFYSVPYSILPILIFMGNCLIIRSYGLKISIFGKGLSIIENHIHTQTLLYVRASTNGIDTGDRDVFISRIEVKGKNISTELSPDEEI